MKINHKPKPRDGEYRISSGFLWFPKTIGSQTRWLEYAKWLECYLKFADGNGFAFYEWIARNWVDDPQWDER